MRFIIIVGGIVLSVVAISRLLRRRRSGPMRRARKEVRRALEDINSTLADLGHRAKKLQGEAKETVQVQVRALEGRRQELLERLQSAAAESAKESKRAPEAATAA
jgi:gas vesicle protein